MTGVGIHGPSSGSQGWGSSTELVGGQRRAGQGARAVLSRRSVGKAGREHPWAYPGPGPCEQGTGCSSKQGCCHFPTSPCELSLADSIAVPWLDLPGVFLSALAIPVRQRYVRTPVESN